MTSLPRRGKRAILFGPMRSLLSLALLLCAGSSTSVAQEGRVRPTLRPPGDRGANATLERVLREARSAQRAKASRPPKKDRGAPPPASTRSQEELVRDAVAHESERRAELLASAPRRFRVIDLDGSGWLSYREAAALLSISKSDFLTYDTDQDGRWTRTEFTERDRALFDLLGSTAAAIPSLEELQRRREQQEAPGEPAAPVVARATPVPTATRTAEPKARPSGSPHSRESRPPRAASPPDQAPAHLPERARPAIPAGLRLYPSPGQLLALFDQDGSRGLSEPEVELIVEQAGGELSADLIVQQTDRNGSGELELAELGALSFFVSDRLTPELRRQVEGLSRAVPGSGAVEDPARETGPFGRLDGDHDGRLEASDLRELAGPYAVGVRFEAVLAALDRDGDGRVDRAEFRAALRAPSRTRETSEQTSALVPRPRTSDQRP